MRLQPVVLYACVVTALGSSCIGSGRREQPAVVPNPYPCVITDPTNWGLHWSELSYDHDASRHCPYVIPSVGTLIPFDLSFYVTPILQPRPWYYAAREIRDNQGTLRTQPITHGNSRFYFINLGGGHLEAQINDWYPGGHGVGLPRDSAFVSVLGGSLSHEFPWVAAVLPGRLEGPPPQISGSAYVVANYSQAWSAQTWNFDLSYRYRWLVDGIELPGETGWVMHTILDPGQHSVELIAILSDGSQVSSVMEVTAVDCGGPYIC